MKFFYQVSLLQNTGPSNKFHLNYAKDSFQQLRLLRSTLWIACDKIAMIAAASAIVFRPVRWARRNDSSVRFALLFTAAALIGSPLSPPHAPAAGLTGQSGVFKVVKPPPKGARKRITIHSGVSRATTE